MESPRSNVSEVFDDGVMKRFGMKEQVKKADTNYFVGSNMKFSKVCGDCNSRRFGS